MQTETLMPDFPGARRAELLLGALGADAEFRDAIIGDLAEEFAIRVGWDGHSAARRWYYRECMRVAPYLLRDWWRTLGWSDGVRLASVVLWSSLSVAVFEGFLQRGVRSLVMLSEGRALESFPVTAGFAAFMLSWTLVDGTFAGYLSAGLGRRAPVPSALVVGLVTICVMMWSGRHVTPSWLLAANVTTMLAGAIVGAVLRTGALRRVPPASTGPTLQGS
jgi:hypothetical protein